VAPRKKLDGLRLKRGVEGRDALNRGRDGVGERGKRRASSATVGGVPVARVPSRFAKLVLAPPARRTPAGVVLDEPIARGAGGHDFGLDILGPEAAGVARVAAVHGGSVPRAVMVGCEP